MTSRHEWDHHSNNEITLSTCQECGLLVMISPDHVSLKNYEFWVGDNYIIIKLPNDLIMDPDQIIEKYDINVKTCGDVYVKLGMIT